MLSPHIVFLYWTHLYFLENFTYASSVKVNIVRIIDRNPVCYRGTLSGSPALVIELIIRSLTLRRHTSVKLHKEHTGCSTPKGIQMCAVWIFFYEKITE